MQRSTLMTILVLASALLPATTRASEVLEELRSSLFQEANVALGAANTARASLLSPTNYAEAADYYRDAEDTLTRGGNIDAIRRDLKKATEAFRKATEQAGLAATTFQTAIAAREDAVNADAESYAPDEWRSAEVTFKDAAVRLEKERIERAQQKAGEAETQYRAAELLAIKANYLNETRTLLEQARDVRAQRWAPQSYQKASDLLAQAETSLETNRYDTDEPRNLARAAKHEAQHAIYVAKLAQAINSGDTSLEAVLLDWETGLTSLADLYGLVVHFDNGDEEAVEQLKSEILKAQAENRTLQASLEDREIQLKTLVEETASMERLSKLVERQERQKQKLATVEALFTDDEAVVLRQGDGIVLRMIGLNFDPGSATLKPEHQVLLRSLERAINEFPESQIIIEGHTDAFGSDTTNLVLSQRRAEAVQQYLLDHTPVSPANLTALGYGETRPVANNETEEGRKRNRRIDVVIYPKW